MSSTGVFDTQEVRPWNQPRSEQTKTVAFPRPFSSPPCLPLGLKQLDVDCCANIRVKAYTSDVTRTGACFHIDSWADTKLYSAAASWLGLATNDHEFQYGQFATTDDHVWNAPKAETSRRIAFQRPFASTPKVISFFNELDLANGANWRITTKVTDIDCNGFTIHINTWSNSTVWSATVGWIAHPPNCRDVFSGSENTSEIRSWQNPARENSKAIDFCGLTFSKIPSVFIAINTLDIDCNHNLRIKTSVDNVTCSGLTWHIDAWADTILYAGGISYLCFVPRPC